MVQFVIEDYILALKGDWHGLELEKLGPTFSSFNDMPAKNTKQKYYC